MRFNTSGCSFLQKGEGILYDNIGSVCSTIIPAIIVSKQTQYEVKQTNLIQFFFVVLVLTVVIFIIACAIRYHHVLETKFKNLQDDLEKKKSRSSGKRGEI
jgi:ATP/ADP translocase